jgi:hypothetical protein
MSQMKANGAARGLATVDPALSLQPRLDILARHYERVRG